MAKGIVITLSDGSTKKLRVNGPDAAGVDRRIAQELKKYPTATESIVTDDRKPDWETYFPTSPPLPPDPVDTAMQGARARLRAKELATMTPREKDELLILMAQRLRLVDEAGKVV